MSIDGTIPGFTLQENVQEYEKQVSRPARVRFAKIKKRSNGQERTESDLVVVEEPLEISLGFFLNEQWQEKSLSITMRTPGHDSELAAGFLFTEGIIPTASAIAGICSSVGSEGEIRSNRVRVDLHAGLTFEEKHLHRHFYTTSSCGVCGKASLDALRINPRLKILPDQPKIDGKIIETLAQKLKSSQELFHKTGGLHAAGLFTSKGRLVCLREDVGRHNAVDKLIGKKLLAGQLPLTNNLMMVSGRTSFEILQKALVAGIAIVVAVSAPSSLAVDIARDFGMTLVGFVRPGRYNIYTGAERIT